MSIISIYAAEKTVRHLMDRRNLYVVITMFRKAKLDNLKTTQVRKSRAVGPLGAHKTIHRAPFRISPSRENQV